MTTIQIRGVPDSVHRVLKMRAANQGQSMNDYLLTELTKIAERPTVDEIADRIARLGASELSPAAEILAAERKS